MQAVSGLDASTSLTFDTVCFGKILVPEGNLRLLRKHTEEPMQVAVAKRSSIFAEAEAAE
jgi:hypothetical protein